MLFAYVLRGRGWSAVNGAVIEWQEGDFFVLPASSRSTHHAIEDTAFYWVTDEPLRHRNCFNSFARTLWLTKPH